MALALVEELVEPMALSEKDTTGMVLVGTKTSDIDDPLRRCSSFA